VKFVAQKPQYVKFLNIENSVLDLGLCYIDAAKKYATVAPLLIQSVYEVRINITVTMVTSVQETVSISVQSNLTNQVFVFQDKELSVPASSEREVHLVGSSCNY
jgi:hypothetical protein